MGLVYSRRRKTGKRSWLNFSGSGVSASTKLGPVTVNSRGRITIRLGRGFSFRL